MYSVVKRDGKEVGFDIKKITVAIEKAFNSIEKAYDENIVDFIALKVTSDFSSKVKDGKITVEISRIVLRKSFPRLVIRM